MQATGQGGEPTRVVVVGGGVGGLATAGRLAAAGGFDVTVLEKNAQVTPPFSPPTPQQEEQGHQGLRS